MVALRRILCPVDFSDTSHHAFQYAVLLARQMGAELVVLHVIEEAPLFTSYGGLPNLDFPREREDSAQRDMTALVSAADAHGVRIRTQVLHGSNYKAILRFAEENQMDLIVMGTHGRSGLDYAIFGSVTERVMRKAPCPLLIVRPPGSRKAAGK
jgi:nucleotide-binding universal stress UspA family protein